MDSVLDSFAAVVAHAFAWQFHRACRSHILQGWAEQRFVEVRGHYSNSMQNLGAQLHSLISDAGSLGVSAVARGRTGTPG